jgi:hypothetical protein
MNKDHFNSAQTKIEGGVDEAMHEAAHEETSEKEIPLSEKNAHKNDPRIKFQDEGHKYWIDDDGNNLISCTTFIHSFFSDFDSDTVIRCIVRSAAWRNDPSYKYYQMKPADIKKSWDDNSKDASSRGTAMHALIEKFYNNVEISFDEDEMPEMTQFLNFYQDHENLVIYRTEWMVFAEDVRITGSIDAVFIDESDGSLIIGDWKRSKKITRPRAGGGGAKRAKHPLSHIEDCNYNHYCLQLNLYRFILERYYGFVVKAMFLGVFHPQNTNNKYIKIDVPIMQAEAELLIESRRGNLCKNDQEDSIHVPIDLCKDEENTEKAPRRLLRS